MVNISDASYKNETHMVNSRFNEDSKNIIFLAREGLPEYLGKWPKTGKPIVMGVVNSNREYWPLPPSIKVFALLLLSCMLDQIIC